MTVTRAGSPNRVSQVTDATGTWNYTFTDSGTTRTAVSTGPNSQSTTVVTDMTVGRPTSITNALSQAVGFQYDTQRRVTRVTQPELNYTGYNYDTRGNVTESRWVDKPGGGLADIVTTAVYPATCANPVICNFPTSVTDARGNTTDFTYNTTHGGVLTVTAPAPTTGSARPQMRYTYEQKQARYRNSATTFVNGPAIWVPTQTSQCITGTSCAGTVNELRTTVAYPTTASPNNLLPLSMTSGSGNGTVTSTSAFTWTPNGDMASVDGPLSGTADTTTFRYDAARQMVGVISPDPDAGGPLLRRATRMTYRPDGLVSQVEQGTVTGLTDPNWAAFVPLQRAQVDYDAMLRPTRSRVMHPTTTTVYAVSDTSYDASGRVDCATTRMNLASIPTAACTAGTAGADGPDRIARYGYDTAGRMTSLITGFGTAAAITESLTYRANGTIETVTNGRQYRSTYVYDGHDRLSRARYPNPTTINASSTTDYDEYGYDAGGNVTSWRRRDGTSFAFTYDALNRLTLRDAPGTTPDVTYAYDNLGRTTSASQTGTTLSWTYDALGRVLTQVQPQGTVTRQYDAAGRRTRLTWPGGSPYATYQYNTVGDLTGVCVNATSCAAGSLALYGYDNLGRRTTTTQGSGSVSTWGYDAAGRLTSLNHNLPGTANDLTFTYTYNPAFQIKTRNTSNNLYIYDESDGSLATPANGVDRYTTVGGASTSYSANGDFLSGGVARTYSYNANSELTGIIGGTASTLAYDPAGRLIRQTGTQDSAYLFDGNQVIAAFNGATGSLTQRFVPSDWIDERAATLGGTTVTSPNWASIDERGTVLNTHTASAMTGINTYDAYGQPGPGNIGRFGYTGQMWLPDAQAWHYKARAYHPGLGRFLQTDPIGYGDGLNLYAYVGGDPVNWIDPSGQSAFGGGWESTFTCYYFDDGRWVPADTDQAPDFADDIIARCVRGWVWNDGIGYAPGDPHSPVLPRDGSPCDAPLTTLVGSARAVLEGAAWAADAATVGFAATGVLGPVAGGAKAFGLGVELALFGVNAYDAIANKNFGPLQAQGAGIGARLIPGGRVLQSGLITARGPTGLLRDSRGRFRASHFKNPGIEEAGQIATERLASGAMKAVVCRP